MNRFDGLYSLADAADILGMDASTLRHSILRGALVEGVEAKKFGKQWVITIEGIERYRRESRRPGYARSGDISD